MRRIQFYITAVLLACCLFSNCAYADTLDDTNRLLDFAEDKYPQYFSPAGQPTQQWKKWLFRHYPSTQIYAGINIDGLGVYYRGDAFGDLLYKGTLEDMLAYMEKNSAYADILDDTNRLLDWAEDKYPQYFSPAGQKTQQWKEWLYRYYPSTQNYTGVNIDGLGVYVRGDVFGGLDYINTLEEVLATISTAPTPDTTPNIIGTYHGSGNASNTNCTDDEINTTFSGTVTVEIYSQNGNTFKGTTTSRINFESEWFEGVDELEGAISNDGVISGKITEGYFYETISSGTFNGRLTGNTLTYDFTSSDTEGETCITTGSLSATR